jgi:hypothetical protein
MRRELLFMFFSLCPLLYILLYSIVYVLFSFCCTYSCHISVVLCRTCGPVQCMLSPDSFESFDSFYVYVSFLCIGLRRSYWATPLCNPSLWFTDGILFWFSPFLFPQISPTFPKVAGVNDISDSLYSCDRVGVPSRPGHKTCKKIWDIWVNVRKFKTFE